MNAMSPKRDGLFSQGRIETCWTGNVLPAWKKSDAAGQVYLIKNYFTLSVSVKTFDIKGNCASLTVSVLGFGLKIAINKKV